MLFHTMVTCSDSNEIFMLPTIIYENEPWLVLRWHADRQGEARRPALIIKLAAFEYQHQPNQILGFDYCVEKPMPKSLLTGENIKGNESVVLYDPPVSILIGHS